MVGFHDAENLGPHGSEKGLYAMGALSSDQ